MSGKLVVVNVLAKEAYDDCHIKGSVSIPLDTIEAQAKELDKNQPIVVYCASYECPMSFHGYNRFVSLGFTNVRAYEGGIAQWKKLGLPTEGNCTADYLKNESEPEERGIKTVSAQDLQKEMIDAGLLKA